MVIFFRKKIINNSFNALKLAWYKFEVWWFSSEKKWWKYNFLHTLIENINKEKAVYLKFFSLKLRTKMTNWGRKKKSKLIYQKDCLFSFAIEKFSQKKKENNKGENSKLIYDISIQNFFILAIKKIKELENSTPTMIAIFHLKMKNFFSRKRKQKRGKIQKIQKIWKKV